jgi:hypothetical protein|tara:strand:- start:61 stop:390 length:330 start_codon:yes stop_codon:yes gene_type:complete
VKNSIFILFYLIILCGVFVSTTSSATTKILVEQPISCLASGYDVFIKNEGATSVDVGKIFSWSVPFSRSLGSVILDKPLQPGRFLPLIGALGSSYLEDGKLCIVSFFNE